MLSVVVERGLDFFATGRHLLENFQRLLEESLLVRLTHGGRAGRVVPVAMNERLNVADTSVSVRQDQVTEEHRLEGESVIGTGPSCRLVCVYFIIQNKNSFIALSFFFLSFEF